MSEAMSIERTMQERHKGVRERLGMPLQSRRAVTRQLPPPPPTVVYSYIPVYPEPQRPVDPLDETESQVNIRWKRIVREVCIKHNISLTDIRSHRRAYPIVAARREAMYRLRNETLMSLPEIGRRMGGFDHSTAMHSIAKHEAILKAETEEARQ